MEAYKAPVYDLAFPNGSPRVALQARVLTFQEYRDVRHGFRPGQWKETDLEREDSDRFWLSVVSEMFDLSEDDLSRLALPDVNGLIQIAVDLTMYQSAKILGIEPSPVSVTFLSGRVLDLKPPTLADSRIMVTHDGVEAQDFYLMSACSGLTSEELQALPRPDYLAVWDACRNFLSQDGLYYRSKMSTN